MTKRITHLINKSSSVWDYGETPYYEIGITVNYAGLGHILARSYNWYIIVSTIQFDCEGNHQMSHKIFQKLSDFLYENKYGNLKFRGVVYEKIWKSFLELSDHDSIKYGLDCTEEQINNMFEYYKPVD